MKKTTITITSLALLAILSCWLIFHISCKQEDNCSGCAVSPQALSLLSIYKVGDIAVFKNDMTGVFDTLHVTERDEVPSSCSYPCNKGPEYLNVHVVFTHLAECILGLYGDNSTSGIEYNSFLCDCDGYTTTIQSMTVNGTTYYDVYIPSFDSTKIPSSYRNNMPWKIAYSKSNGIIRCYMVNGQTWSKQ